MSTAFMWLVTFLAVFLLDMCWAYYIRALERGDPMTAALWSCFLFLTAAGATISYVDNPWLLIPAVAGAFFGTLVGAIKSRKEIEPEAARAYNSTTTPP